MQARTLQSGGGGPSPSLWRRYNRSLTRQPMLTKAATSFAGFALGDALAQAMDRRASLTRRPGAFKYDFARTARLALFGATVAGPLGHLWYQFLDQTVMTRAPTSAAAVATKVGLDQLVFAPACTLVLYASLCTMEGRPREYSSTLRDKYWPTMVANWKLWPAAHAVNFALVPSSQRILYANVVSIVGTLLLSRVANRPARP